MDKVIRFVDPTTAGFLPRVEPVVADDCKQHVAAADGVSNHASEISPQRNRIDVLKQDILAQLSLQDIGYPARDV